MCLILPHHCMHTVLLKSILVTRLYDATIDMKEKKGNNFQIKQTYKKNMLYTTEDRILIKHYSLDTNMTVGQYACISE